MEINIVENMMEEGEVPPLDPQLLKSKAIVKVFVIDSNEGYWLDCGAGDAQFLFDEKVADRTTITPDAVAINVFNNYEEPQNRDFIEEAREKKLRNNKDDRNILLEVNLGQGGEFTKCQGIF